MPKKTIQIKASKGRKAHTRTINVRNTGSSSLTKQKLKPEQKVEPIEWAGKRQKFFNEITSKFRHPNSMTLNPEVVNELVASGSSEYQEIIAVYTPAMLDQICEVYENFAGEKKIESLYVVAESEELELSHAKWLLSLEDETLASKVFDNNSANGGVLTAVDYFKLATEVFDGELPKGKHYQKCFDGLVPESERHEFRKNPFSSTKDLLEIADSYNKRFVKENPKSVEVFETIRSHAAIRAYLEEEEIKTNTSYTDLDDEQRVIVAETIEAVGSETYYDYIKNSGINFESYTQWTRDTYTKKTGGKAWW